MAQSVNSKSSLYGDYVFDQLHQIAKRGGGIYTFKEIAEVLKLSPTHNLRKRLRTMERGGLINISYGYVGKCGTCLIYEIVDKSKPRSLLQDIPF